MGKIETLQTWGRALLDFAYPPHCAVCEADIEAAELLCGSCWAEIVPRHPRPRADDGGRAFEKIVALGPFTGVLQQAIHALKFRDQSAAGEGVGRAHGAVFGRTTSPAGLLVARTLAPGSAAGARVQSERGNRRWVGGRARCARVLWGRAAAEKYSAASPFVGRGTPRQYPRCLCVRGRAAFELSDRDSR